MKLKALGLAAVAATAFTAFAASSASATTLEVSGVTQNQAVTLEMSLKSGTSAIWSRTDGSFGNTCTTSELAGDTESPFTGTSVTGAVDFLLFSGCTRPIKIHQLGTLHISYISGTNGTVTWSGTEITVGTPPGTLNCKTGGGVDIGTLTGTASGHAEIHINAVINCGFLVPSASWKATYIVTTPTGLGVSA